MCRNIKTLYNFAPPATEGEIRASALQFVRKLAGFTKPSHANEAAFETAVDRVAEAARDLLAALVTHAPPRDRDVEAAKARQRARALSGYCTVTATAAEAKPFATTCSLLGPVSIVAGTSKCVETINEPVATPIDEWS